MTHKALVVRLEQVIGMDGSPRRLRSAIESELADYFGLPSIQASERAELVESAVARLIARRLADSERMGTTPILSLLGTSSDIVAGFCYVLPEDEPYLSTIKQQRVYAGPLLAAIRGLSFEEFEKFGSRILSEMGARFSCVTPHSGDQGIDFYGQLSMGQLHGIPAPFLKLTHSVVILFAGQAKHYPTNPVGPEVVRELIGAVSLARTKTFSKPEIDIFRDLNLKPFSPLVTLLFSTGDFTRGAIELADSAGVVTQSGEQLSVFLADKGIGIVVKDGFPAFDRQVFIEWLNGA